MKTLIVPLAACPRLITLSADRANSGGKPSQFTLNQVSQVENLTETCQRAAPLRRIRALLLASACAIVAGSCATPPTVEVVKSAPGDEYRTGAKSYQLSERERILCEQKASKGDIMAAKKLIGYHQMVTGDIKQGDYWIRVVERLQKARSKHVQGAPPTVEVLTVSPGDDYRSGVEIYQLSERERLLCERRASKGDILAAKQLVEYHEMVTRDEKQYHYWLRVVDRLQKARLRKTRFAARLPSALP